MASTTWTRATSLKQLQRKGCVVIRRQGRQIAIFDTTEGLFACNNRCPHEGYPLREGSLDESCLLTCNWHNWKFNLKTGENLYGGDRLRTYPVELRDDEIWLDLAELPFDTRRAAMLSSLRDALDDNAYDRIARELGRLRLIGADPLDAVRETIHWSYDRMEFGWTHAYAGISDWLTLYDEHEGDDETRLACLLESVAHVADDVLREEHYPFAEVRAAYEEEAFVAAVEAEDEARAVAMIRGGLAEGKCFEDFERGLSRAALAHYNDFGHSLIYITKVGRLMQRLGESVAEPLLVSLVRGMVFATREELIPEFRGYDKALAAWGRARNGISPRAEDWRGLTINKALERTTRSSGAPPVETFYALLGANAANLLAFDIEQQSRIRIGTDDNVGWLDFTHGITFGNAVHDQCEKFPELWPAALLQMACFCGRNAPYTLDELDLERWHVADPEAFFRDSIESLFDHGVDEFIASVHRMKTLLSARAEVRAGVPNEVAELVTASLNRYLNSPLKLKQVRRTVYQAMKFVAHDG